MRLVSVINRAIIGTAKVYFHPDDGEYMVKFWRGREFQRGAEYFTDCKDDAINTAHAQLQYWVDSEN